jgi:tyrosine decarboxylase
MLSQIGKDNIGKLVVYGSNQTHSALQKAAHVAGIHKTNCRAIETTKSTSFALSPESLRLAICLDIESGLVPMFLCATIGTTATTAVDPLRPLCDVANSYGLWVHVDAAYAGNACICPEFQHFLDGVEGAHSFSLNAHKWFFTTLDCCCLWLKDPKALTKSLSTNPEYLMSNHATNSEQVVNYKDWQIALSRRFRSMKLWLVLRSYGVGNLRSFLRSHVKMAQLFEDLVASDKRFEVVVPRNFAMVCFRALPLAISKEVSENGMAVNGQKISYDQEYCSNQLNQELLKSINASGHVYLTHAVVAGLYIIRFAVGATLTEDRHVFTAWKVVQEHLDAITGM